MEFWGLSHSRQSLWIEFKFETAEIENWGATSRLTLVEAQIGEHQSVVFLRRCFVDVSVHRLSGDCKRRMREG